MLFWRDFARDGGLYLPKEWPALSKKRSGRCAANPIRRSPSPFSTFTNGEIPAAKFREMIDEAYATFRHPAVAPLVQTGPNAFVMELFHGSTLAFKDVAMQLLARLMDYVLARTG